MLFTKNTNEKINDLIEKLKNSADGKSINTINKIIQILQSKLYSINWKIIDMTQREKLICQLLKKHSNFVNVFHKSLSDASEKGEDVSAGEFKRICNGYLQLVMSETLMLLFAFLNMDDQDKKQLGKYKDLIITLESIIK